jgi:hypothetical protein
MEQIILGIIGLVVGLSMYFFSSYMEERSKEKYWEKMMRKNK